MAGICQTTAIFPSRNFKYLGKHTPLHLREWTLKLKLNFQRNLTAHLSTYMPSTHAGDFLPATKILFSLKVVQTRKGHHTYANMIWLLSRVEALLAFCHSVTKFSRSKEFPSGCLKFPLYFFKRWIYITPWNNFWFKIDLDVILWIKCLFSLPWKFIFMIRFYTWVSFIKIKITL